VHLGADLEQRGGGRGDGVVGSAEFLAELQRRFGFSLGRFIKVGRRAAYPLSLSRAQRTSAPRCAIIGNAAQGLHPVAGMGFNLGLRDVASLAELIAERAARVHSIPASAACWTNTMPGAPRIEAASSPSPTGLVRTFSNPLSSVRVLRNLGLLAFDWRRLRRPRCRD
jgi:2-octaprenyl-6-methoxyphenol hydroxylase